MKRLTLHARTSLSFSVIQLLLLALGTFAYLRLDTMGQHSHRLKTDSVVGLHQSGLIKDRLAADYLALAQRRDPETRALAEQQLAKTPDEMARLIGGYDRTISSDADREAFAKFKNIYSSYENARANLLGQGAGGMAIGGGFAREAAARFNSASDAISAIALLNRQNALATAKEIDGEIHSLLIAIITGFTFLILVAVIAGYSLVKAFTWPLKQMTALMETMRQGDFTQRMKVVQNDELGDLGKGFNRMADEVMGLVGQVQRSGIRVTTSMTEIAATSKQQQATASEVAATTTQIGATSREIAATSRELVRTMADVAAVSDHAAELASGGHGELAHMEETMSLVMEAASSINAKLAVLNEKAGDINQVVTTITKVADQTNLLSLNAAIEAEKAGEYGRGFAVVSSEIRRLADQTAVATYDIEQMVKEIQSAVSASVMGMDKFSEQVRRGLHEVHAIGDKLSEVITQVQTLAPRFETVSEGMEAQAIGAEQISEALVQLTDATQQTVESLRQSSSAIDELDHVSGNLQDSVARFKLAAA